MTNTSLARSYLDKAKLRLEMLGFLMDKQGYSDVVREAQEVVELALKGVLRQVGVEPPKWHDVGSILEKYRDRFPAPVASQIGRLGEISAWLREERELAFYGDIDFIPTDEYSVSDAARAIEDARFVVSIAETVIGSRE